MRPHLPALLSLFVPLLPLTAACSSDDGDPTAQADAREGEPEIDAREIDAREGEPEIDAREIDAREGAPDVDAREFDARPVPPPADCYDLTTDFKPTWQFGEGTSVLEAIMNHDNRLVLSLGTPALNRSVEDQRGGDGDPVPTLELGTQYDVRFEGTDAELLDREVTPFLQTGAWNWSFQGGSVLRIQPTGDVTVFTASDFPLNDVYLMVLCDGATIPVDGEGYPTLTELAIPGCSAQLIDGRGEQQPRYIDSDATLTLARVACE